MARTVLVPTEGSPLSMKALEVAVTDYSDADIVVLHVMDPIGSGKSLFDVMRPKLSEGAPPGTVTPDYWREWRREAEESAQVIFDAAREIAADAGRSIETALEFGDPADVIIEYVETHNVDRVVMGSHCRRGAERFLLGSVAETVVKRAPIPVLIVR